MTLDSTAARRCWSFISEPDDAHAAHAGGVAPGDTLAGRYRLEACLGEGATARVFRAHDLELSRPVAVKVLGYGVAGRRAHDRLMREARAAAALHHPHLVALYDVGEDEGRLFLVMELVTGPSLASALASRRYERRALLRVLEKVARAVHHAHEAGVVHRDLKPGNVLLDEAEDPRVVDFGLAHLAEGDTVMTRTGVALGTPAYMAPEQVAGRWDRVGPRTDVWALGAILYEIVSGRPPHVGGSVAEIYAKVLGDEPAPLRRLDRSAARDLETIAARALEREPRARYADAVSFGEDLRRHLDGEPILARPVAHLERVRKLVRRHPAVASLLAVLVVGTAVAITIIARAGLELREEQRQRRRLLLEKTSRAGARLDLAGEERERYDALSREIAELEARALELAPAGQGSAITPSRRELWRTKRQIEAATRERDDLFSRITGHLIQALGIGVSPASDQARHALANLYWDALTEAERRGDDRRAATLTALVRQYDDEAHGWERRLLAPGRVLLESRPPGAQAEILRYETAPDGRLTERPHAAPAPLPLDVTLPPGSYLFRLRHEGSRDVRLPVRVDRGSVAETVVNLHPGDVIGEGFVYVPAGPFISGGDDRAYEAAPRRTDTATGDFFIARHEVTLGEYRDFLRDVLDERGPRAARALAPSFAVRWIADDATEIRLPSSLDLRTPAIALSWTDADAYCRWLTRLAAEDGEPYAYRLPTSLEWEKAARGVDGRAFPWGNVFDWSFVKGGSSRLREKGRYPEPVGTFAADESPYGVRDLGGGAREWCQEWADERFGWKPGRGGAWSFSSETLFRSAGRFNNGPIAKRNTYGFRVVRVPTD